MFSWRADILLASEYAAVMNLPQYTVSRNWIQF